MRDKINKRLDKKFKFLPKWAEDFSVDTNQDTDVSRRDFIRFLFLVSVGLFTGMTFVYLKGIFASWQKPSSVKAVKIINKNKIEVGQSHVFQIPNTEEPAIMVRLAPNRYVAYSQKCTHLQCPVLWEKEKEKLICPCHKGAFSIQTGDVLYGPPERALPKVQLMVKSDGVYYAGTTK